jgi:murein DD-endopeptidase MepM/ murein hydrolase activator NlpD
MKNSKKHTIRRGGAKKNLRPFRELFQKLLSPDLRLKAIAASIVIVLGTALIGMQAYRWTIQSRTVTQEQIAEGWKAAGVELTEHTIQQKENFWQVAKEYNVDIDTIVGANPGLGKLSATRGQTIRVLNQKGVIHAIAEQETVRTISELYKVTADKIASVNNLRPNNIFAPGLELFIPNAKPKKLSEEMTAQYGLRGIFCSPLPGRITSGMGMRKHPVGGFRGKHTGIDLAAKEGTGIAAAADGTVVQTGEGEYIGKFVIVSHDNLYTTIYGHCSKILMTPGKAVKKGQIIAKSGHTGRVTGPHLHFEIRKNNVPRDPLKYLW